jgi:hypothetical protein
MNKHEVIFNNKPITVVILNDNKYVAMKHVSDALGLDWSAQLKRIKDEVVLSEAMVVTAIPSSSGTQETVLLPIEYLNGWLFGISEKRVKPELKDLVVMYKRECYKVLSDYFKPKQRLPENYFKLPGDKSMRHEMCYQVKDYHAKHIINIIKELSREFYSGEITIEALGSRASENRVFQNNNGLFREILFNSTLDALRAEDIIEVSSGAVKFL